MENKLMYATDRLAIFAGIKCQVFGPIDQYTHKDEPCDIMLATIQIRGVATSYTNDSVYIGRFNSTEVLDVVSGTGAMVYGCGPLSMPLPIFDNVNDEVAGNAVTHLFAGVNGELNVQFSGLPMDGTDTVEASYVVLLATRRKVQAS